MNNEPQPSPEDIARLERLSQRRAAMPHRPAVPPPLPPFSGSPLTGPPRAGAPLTGPPRHAGAPAMQTPALTRRQRRRHPARGARLGALIVSCATTGGLAYLVGATGTSSAGSGTLSDLPAPVATTPVATAPASTAPAVMASSGPATTPPTPSADVATTSPAVAVPVTTPAVSAFDGSVVNTRYGPVQVQVQVSNGSLIEVAVAQFPDGDRKSVRINERALPTLRSEVLSAQSADVDTVSGATYTSNGYVVSLQSALDRAAAAGVAVTA